MSSKRTTVIPKAPSSREPSARSGNGTSNSRVRVSTIRRTSAFVQDRQVFKQEIKRLTHESIEKSAIREDTLYPSLALQAALHLAKEGEWQRALVGIAQVASDAVWVPAIVDLMQSKGVNAYQHHTKAWDISVLAESGRGRPAKHEVKVASISQKNKFQAHIGVNQFVKGNHLLFVTHPVADNVEDTKFVHVSMNDLKKLHENPSPGATLSVNLQQGIHLTIDLAVLTEDVTNDVISPRVLNFDEFTAYAAAGLR